jgi:hypothetical protein
VRLAAKLGYLKCRTPVDSSGFSVSFLELRDGDFPKQARFFKVASSGDRDRLAVVESGEISWAKVGSNYVEWPAGDFVIEFPFPERSRGSPIITGSREVCGVRKCGKLAGQWGEGHGMTMWKIETFIVRENLRLRGPKKGSEVMAPSEVLYKGRRIRGMFDLYGRAIVTESEVIGLEEVEEIELAAVRELPTHAFQGSQTLRKVALGSSITSIPDSAFRGCTALVEFPIPPSVVSIEGSALGECSALTTLVIPATVKSLGASVCSSCTGLKSVQLLSAATRVPNCGFSNCNGLTSISISANATEFESYALNGCSALTDLVIPANVKIIGNFAFRGCSSLTKLVIPASVTKIGDNALQGCTGLTCLSIPRALSEGSWDSWGLHDAAILQVRARD